jgi:hypothetical protein
MRVRFGTALPAMPIVLALTVLIQTCFIFHVLQATGQAEAARAELETMLAHAKRFRIRHEEEKEWVAAARRGTETG